MKIAAGQIDGFLRRPDPQIRAVLLYGPDAGLVRERADTLAKTICPELHDPFRVAELTGAILAAEDLPELGAEIEIERRNGAGFLGRLHGFDDQFTGGFR